MGVPDRIRTLLGSPDPQQPVAFSIPLRASLLDQKPMMWVQPLQAGRFIQTAPDQDLRLSLERCKDRG